VHRFIPRISYNFLPFQQVGYKHFASFDADTSPSAGCRGTSVTAKETPVELS